MENPVTATRATDEDHVGARRVRSLAFFAKDIGSLTLDVEVNETDVLYTHVGANDRVPLGAAIVMTRGFHGALRIGIVYKNVLTADRGEGYADDYYDGGIPTLRVDRNDARWALDALHDSDDLRDPGLVRKRLQKLDRIVDRNAGSGSARKRKAAADAERAKRVSDKNKRRNPIAAAMANWGATVQLDKELRIALGADERVSRSRLAIVRLLAGIWKTFHDVDVELASMERWWSPTRRRPLPFSQSKRLATRVARVGEEVCLVTAAPYGQMPLLTQLHGELDALVGALRNATEFRRALPLLASARRTVAALLIHRMIAQMLVTAGKARRFKKPVTGKQRREYLAAADRTMDRIAGEVAALGGRPPAFLRALERRVSEAKKVGLEEVFNAEEAYNLLSEASELFLERPAT